MLVFTEAQMASFQSLAETKLKGDVYTRLLRDYPALAEDEDEVRTWLDGLCADGFDSYGLLLGVTLCLLRIGLRTDPGAAEARAVAGAIVQQESPAQARLDFLKAQKLETAPEAD